MFRDMVYHYINVREYRRANQKWTIQRYWQHRIHKTKTNKTKTQHKMCWTPLRHRWVLVATIRTPMSIGGYHYDTDEYWWLPLRHQWVLVVTITTPMSIGGVRVLVMSITTPMSIGGYHYDTDEYWWCPCWIHKTKTNKTKTQHKMCWTPQYADTNNVSIIPPTNNWR
jgi:hypothetical protein